MQRMGNGDDWRSAKFTASDVDKRAEALNRLRVDATWMDGLADALATFREEPGDVSRLNAYLLTQAAGLAIIREALLLEDGPTSVLKVIQQQLALTNAAHARLVAFLDAASE